MLARIRQGVTTLKWGEGLALVVGFGVGGRIGEGEVLDAEFSPEICLKKEGIR
jgi:hypothetical protein